MTSTRLRLCWLVLFGLSAARAGATDLSDPADGVVVAAHPAAAEAGRRVLAEGGHALDAAVAVGLTLGVAEPWGSGLGGKVVLVYREAATGRVHTVEALDEAGAGLDPDTFTALPRAQRAAGPASVGVPGMLAGWAEAHRRWGTRPWASLMQPAIDAATDGVVVDRYDRHALEAAAEKLDAGGGREVFGVDGVWPEPGDRVRYPDLAETLTAIRDDGAAAFYGGELGRRIADHIQQAGGQLTLDDLAGYRPAVTEAWSVTYAGAEVHAAPPPATGGATLLLALACLEQWNHATPDRRAESPVDRIEAEARVLFHIYPQVRRRLGARGDAAAALHQLLGPASVAELLGDARSFDAHHFSAGLRSSATRSAAVTDGLPLGCTSHFVVADAAGNVVSATQSLSHHYGSGVVVPGTGVVMNNTLLNFAVRTPSSPNYAGPGLRPRSTMTPVIVTRGGRPELALGAAGGQRIPTAVLRSLRDILDGRATPDHAVHRPRVHVRHALSGPQRLEVHLEPGPGTPELADRLQARGWRPRVLTSRTMYFGGLNAAYVDEDGRWVGVGDDRRTHTALPVPSPR